MRAHLLEEAMILTVLLCPYCKSKEVVRNGHAPNGKQKYLCKDCKRQTRENPTARGYSEKEKELILRAYEERSSLRGLKRTCGVDRNTVSTWIKKNEHVAGIERNAGSARSESAGGSRAGAG